MHTLFVNIPFILLLYPLPETKGYAALYGILYNIFIYFYMIDPDLLYF